ncbi:MAG: hypothetical protein JXA24_01180, partial [Proteobacteria bacterium]|nr:hypothetical protein [Pseudomonadota bacterium]
VHSSFDSLPWVFPSAFLEFQGQGIEVLGNTFSRSLDVAGEKIGNFGHVIANPDAVMQSINSLSHESIPSAGDLLRSFRDAMAGVSAALFASNIVWPEILKFFRQDRRWLWLAPGFALFNLDLATMPGFDGWHFLEHAYTYGAAAVFLMQMRRDMTPAHKEHLNYASMAFLPGAFMLSADIGCWLAPGPNDPTYAERLIRAGLLTVESYFMMKILGNVKWHWDHRETAATNVLTLMKQTFSANAALPLSMVIVNAFTAPLGGYIQRDKTLDNVVLIALQGVATTVCMLPITLGISGVLKQTIPILTRAKEGLDDSRAAGDGSMKRAYHTLVGGVSAFNTTYAHNRIFRSGYWDIIPALFRTLMGWDTFAGQLAMSGTNIVHGNGVSTRMWPELSGTTWSRQSVKKEFENATDKRLQIDQRMANKTLSPEDARWERGMVHAQIRTFFQEAAQVMHPAHLFMSHEALTDRLIPFYSFTMAARPPTFPQLPDRHFLADFYLMLHGGHPNERLDLEEFITLLDYVKADASDPSAYDTVRPLVQLLALARDNMDPEYRKLIEDFFAENPEVPLMVNVELAEHPPLHEKYRRIARKKVRGKVRMEFKDYERRVNGHNRQKRAHDKLEGLFLF